LRRAWTTQPSTGDPPSDLDLTRIAADVSRTARRLIRHLQHAQLLPAKFGNRVRPELVEEVDWFLRSAWDRPKTGDLLYCRTSLARQSVGVSAFALQDELRINRRPIPDEVKIAAALYTQPKAVRVFGSRNFLVGGASKALETANEFMSSGMFIVDPEDLIFALQNPAEAKIATGNPRTQYDHLVGVFANDLAVDRSSIHPPNARSRIEAWAKGTFRDDLRARILSNYSLRGFVLHQDADDKWADLVYHFEPEGQNIIVEATDEVADLLRRYVMRSVDMTPGLGFANRNGQSVDDEFDLGPADTSRLAPIATVARLRGTAKGTHRSPETHWRVHHLVDHPIKEKDYRRLGVGVNEPVVPGAKYFWRSQRSGAWINAPEDEADEGETFEGRERKVGSNKDDSHLYGTGDVFWKTVAADGMTVTGSGYVGRHPRFTDVPRELTPTPTKRWESPSF
jgi:hypothetical protein